MIYRHILIIQVYWHKSSKMKAYFICSWKTSPENFLYGRVTDCCQTYICVTLCFYLQLHKHCELTWTWAFEQALPWNLGSMFYWLINLVLLELFQWLNACFNYIFKKALDWCAEYIRRCQLKSKMKCLATTVNG